MAVRFKAYVCSHLIAGIAVSNPVEGMDVRLLCLFVSGLCDELITRSEDSYRVACLIVCDSEISETRRPRPNLGCATKKNLFL